MDPSRNPLRSIRDWTRRRSAESRSVSLAHLGMTYAAAVALYALGGWWPDNKLGTLPAFTIAGVTLGAVGGFIWIYREVLRAEERERREKERREAEEKDSP